MSSIPIPSHTNTPEIADAFKKIGEVHSLMDTIPMDKIYALKLDAWAAWNSAVHTAWDKWGELVHEQAPEYIDEFWNSWYMTYFAIPDEVPSVYNNPMYNVDTTDNNSDGSIN